MFDIALMVGGVMLFCAVIFLPFVLWDLYKKKKRGVTEVSKQSTGDGKKTIIWWKAGLCGLVLISFFVYFVIKAEVDFILPALIAYPYYGLVGWCLYFVTGKKIVFKSNV